MGLLGEAHVLMETESKMVGSEPPVRTRTGVVASSGAAAPGGAVAQSSTGHGAQTHRKWRPVLADTVGAYLPTYLLCPGWAQEWLHRIK